MQFAQEKAVGKRVKKAERKKKACKVVMSVSFCVEEASSEDAWCMLLEVAHVTCYILKYSINCLLLHSFQSPLFISFLTLAVVVIIVKLKFWQLRPVTDAAFTIRLENRRGWQADRVSVVKRAFERPKGHDRSYERASPACERASTSCSHARKVGASFVCDYLCPKLSNVWRTKLCACEVFQAA